MTVQQPLWWATDTADPSVSDLLRELRTTRRIPRKDIAVRLGTSLAAVTRWEEGTSEPSPAQRAAIEQWSTHGALPASDTFASHGARGTSLAVEGDEVALAEEPGEPVLARVTRGRYVMSSRPVLLADLLATHTKAVSTATVPPITGMSAGKNTYTYDAHTYHTKVPPQGIAELLRHYLPEGGLVLDPFAGSGMTAVASNVVGADCILNELSPAATFLASRFVSSIAPDAFNGAISSIVQELSALREQLYTTTCRECSLRTELLYTVWSYKVSCPACEHQFQLWDECRSYGKTVRDHKILTEFPCPRCNKLVKKRTLKRHHAEPVQIAYKCCGSRAREVVHPPDANDLLLLEEIEATELPSGWYPNNELPDGVNLNQPKHHGLTSVDRLYTRRNLLALAHLWRTIHRIEDPQLAAQVAFAFTSLYRRVSRLSEFRFWGGSGNSARLNVPYIFEESNVFLSFLRKARTVTDHLSSTATHYTGRTAVRTGSATNLDDIPDESVDLVFTDPPFGSNINYSEMNLLWESWLGSRTDDTHEAIINKFQHKNLADYGRLMEQALVEAYRTLRRGGWMLLVFMNSSAQVWDELHRSITGAGFVIVAADVFDKQHGTFKHFVSENTAGADLVLHCRRPFDGDVSKSASPAPSLSVHEFITNVDDRDFVQKFIHVSRPDEPDARRLYSLWLAQAMTAGQPTVDFSHFREQWRSYVAERSGK